MNKSVVLSLTALILTGGLLAACEDESSDPLPTPTMTTMVPTMVPSMSLSPSPCPTVSVSVSPSASPSVSVSVSPDANKNDVKGDGGVAFRQPVDPPPVAPTKVFEDC
jgi:hypothetical protein